MDARAVTAALHGKWMGQYGVCRCPVHADKTPSLKVRDDPHRSDGLNLHCFAGCDWKSIKDALRRAHILPEFTPRRAVAAPRAFNWQQAPAIATLLNRQQRPPMAGAIGATLPSAEIDTGNRDRALKTWKVATPLSDLARHYLMEVRGLDIRDRDLSHCLRWHQYSGAIIALMTNPVSGAPTGIHRTLLNVDGTKRERKMLGNAGLVRLSPDEEVAQGLRIAEGIEDGLAILACGWAPIWAGLTCGGIERLPVIGGIECLTIFHDKDTAGTRAAEICAARWAEAGREVYLA